MIKASPSALLVALAVSVSACSSPETPPAGTTPSVAANPSPAAAPAPAPAPAAPRTIDGYPEMPAITSELAGNVRDLQKDLQNIVAKQPAANAEFEDDLKKLMGDEDAATRPAVTALSRELAEALPAATEPEALVTRLADLLVVAARRRVPLAADRVTALAAEVQKLLVTHGVPDARAKVVGGHVRAIASQVRGLS